MAAGDFYTTTAQVIPVLLLAIVWESEYLRNLPSRSDHTVRFWKKPRVFLWSTFMSTLALVTEGVMILVLADVLSPSSVWKAFAIAAVASLLVTMAVRLITDIRQATR